MTPVSSRQGSEVTVWVPCLLEAKPLARRPALSLGLLPSGPAPPGVGALSLEGCPAWSEPLKGGRQSNEKIRNLFISYSINISNGRNNGSRPECSESPVTVIYWHPERSLAPFLKTSLFFLLFLYLPLLPPSTLSWP